MRRVNEPRYRIELSCVSFVSRKVEWHSYAFHGKLKKNSAKEYRDGFNRSLDGVNKHIKHTQSYYSNARIINQSTGEIVQEYIAPMFEVID